MGKRVSTSKLSEWKGLDRISTTVHAMRCIFREISKDDFGIDGEIEVVVPSEDGTGLMTQGGVIKVQGKAGRSYIKGDTPTEFHTAVERNDLLTWRNSTYPVVFIIYHPEDDCLYWKDVKAYLQATPTAFQVPLHFLFDKAADRFDDTCYAALCQLVQQSPPRISFEQKERLFSNLFPIKKVPGILTYAPTTERDYRSIRNQIKGFVPPYVLAEGNLYTLADLRDTTCGLRAFCDIKAIRDLQSSSWISDPIWRSRYIMLLNQVLHKYAARCGIRYNPVFKRYYFPREDEERLAFKRKWRNIRTEHEDERTAAKYYEYGSDHFWRHLAANLHFIYIAPSWFLSIVPKYFFTEDGVIPYDRDKAGPFTTRKKALEHNDTVLNHVLFWIDALSREQNQTPGEEQASQQSLLSEPQEVIEVKLGRRPMLRIEKMPLIGVAPFAIPSDPARFDEQLDAPQQLDLFAQLYPVPLEDDDDDYYM